VNKMSFMLSSQLQIEILFSAYDSQSNGRNVEFENHPSTVVIVIV
jgi:hypothetical protein